MNEKENIKAHWTPCPECHGRGKIGRKLRKKVRLQYKRDLEQYEKMDGQGSVPIRPRGAQVLCLSCEGSGLIPSTSPPIADTEHYPHLAIIGGGIGGVALAVACLHRGIPFTLYEWDASFDARSQGYGLTLQQATRAIKGLGISSLDQGVISTRHVVHTTEGEVVGEWGMRMWNASDANKTPKRTNVHIARQALRLALLEQLGGEDQVAWGYQLLDFKETEGEGVALRFEVDGKIKNAKADLVVGADGIRSTVRKLLIGEEMTPLRYLGCIVILGICPLADFDATNSDLLDGATVFQTANGNERIYMMPYASDSVMWQLSFPMPEHEAMALSAKGAQALKEEACRRTQWHDPIPQILAASKADLVSGYPVYDRALLTPEMLDNGKQITLLGDAAHPMSPFKGQGANQALLDALSLGRLISKTCGPFSDWKTTGLRDTVLRQFESEMIKRSASKVKDSAAAAEYLHSDAVLHPDNAPRGRFLKNESSKSGDPNDRS